MIDQHPRSALALALAVAAMMAPACAPEAPSAAEPEATASSSDDLFTAPATDDAPGTETTGERADTGIVAPSISQTYPKLLGEIADQLEAGDWRPYLQVRAEVGDGQHVGALVEALSQPDGLLPRVASVLLEDLLNAPSAPAGMTPVTHAALRDLARPVLGTLLADASASELRPLATRILGRFPRGQTQILLFERLTQEVDPGLRAMTLAALGDNVDTTGVGVLQARFADLTACLEVRHAAIAARAAHEALPAVDLRPWLADEVAPRALACATAAVEAGEDPDADLHALIRAFDQPPGQTLVEQVLLLGAPTALKVHALRLLRAAGDSTTAALLLAAGPDLAAEGLDAAAAEVAAILGAPGQ